jgi:tellurite resistance protein
MTMPTVAEAQLVYDNCEAMSLEASENVDQIRTEVALGQATQKQLDRALKAEQQAIQRRLTAEAGLQACKLAARAADEEERQRNERISQALRREGRATYMKQAREFLSFVRLADDRFAAQGESFASLEQLVGRGGANYPHLHGAWSAVTRALPLIIANLEFEERRFKSEFPDPTGEQAAGEPSE